MLCDRTVMASILPLMELSSIPAEVEEDDETANYEELLRRIQEKLNSPEYQPGEAFSITA